MNLLLLAISTAWVYFAAPTYDNTSLCGATPILVANVSDSVMCHVAWTGPSTGEDSIKVKKGNLSKRAVVGLPGNYVVKAWASDPGGVGCPTFVNLVLGDTGKPDSVRVFK
jgi:hypothetical protein